MVGNGEVTECEKRKPGALHSLGTSVALLIAKTRDGDVATQFRVHALLWPPLHPPTPPTKHTTQQKTDSADNALRKCLIRAY